MFDELIGHVTNFEILKTTFQGYIDGLSVNTVIFTIMMIFMIVGAVDKMRGNKLGYGAQFDAGFEAMGPTAAALVGVVAAAPVLAVVLEPILSPIFTAIGASPAMFATIVLANDMGGYPLAMELAGSNEAIGNFAGLIQGAMMGATLVFIIPVALSIIKPEDRPFLGTGILVGLVTIPLGCIVGGLVMNMTPYKMELGTILINLVPMIVIAAIICVCLWFFPNKMIEGFNKFGKGITVVITALTAIAVFQYQTGIWFPLFSLMVDAEANGGSVPLIDGIVICGQIAIVLIGAFPMVAWFTKTFQKPLQKIGKHLGMDENGSAGIVATMANSLATFNILHSMNPKAKLLNISFAVSASWVFGDHLGFTAGANPEMIFPVIVGKLTAGITALLLANLLSNKLLEKIAVMQGEK